MHSIAIIKGTLTASGSEQLVNNWIENNRNFSLFLYQQRNWYARMRKTVNKIQCAINWINNPRRTVGQFTFCAAFTCWFFANETKKKTKYFKMFSKCFQNVLNYDLGLYLPMMRKFCDQSIYQQFFHFLIGFSDQIDVAQLRLDIFTLPKSACDQLKCSRTRI